MKSNRLLVAAMNAKHQKKNGFHLHRRFLLYAHNVMQSLATPDM